MNGFPPEQTVLAHDIDRVFVIGVAPRKPRPPVRNCIAAAQRAADGNQYREVLHGIDEAEANNRMIREWREAHDAARAVVERDAPSGDLRDMLFANVDDAFARAEFPYSRKPVEMVPILPAQDTGVSILKFDPVATRHLMQLGRDTRARLSQ